MIISMCGIFGILGNMTNINDIFYNFNKLRLRGPDRSKIIYDNNYFLGFHRLAINGLDYKSDQPFIYKCTNNITYIIMVNGEIYNYKNLIKKYKLDNEIDCHSDCAIVYPLFKYLNFDFNKLCDELNGEFALSIIKIVDNIISNVYLSSDPLCVRPLFWFYDNNNYRFGFSSLLSVLSNLVDESIKINRINQGETIIYDYEDHTYTIEKYYDKIINLDTNNYINDNDDNIIYKNLYDVFNKCVVKRLISDRPIGCLLSGGLDSSLVCAIICKYYYENYPNKKLKTFSIGMKGGTDIEYANIVVDHLSNLYNNIDHTTIYFTEKEGLEAIDNVIRVTETWDITTIRASVGQYLLAKFISENTDVKVILNGDGADEAQMGYLYFHNHPDLLSAQLDHYKLLDNIHLYDGLRVDRNISTFGLEARVPYLDIEFIDYCRNLPSAYKIPRKSINDIKIEKYLIRKAYDIHDNNLLPNEVLWRKKEAFSDGISSTEKSWFITVKKYINDKISDEEFNINSKKYYDKLSNACDQNNYDLFTKEMYYYLKTFCCLFNNNINVIPKYWLPNWNGNIFEPSARVLKIYE